MMRRNHRGEKLCRPVLSLTSVAPPAVGLKNKCRSRACMIHMSFLPAQHLLKILAVFSKIVKFPQNFTPGPIAQRAQKLLA